MVWLRGRLKLTQFISCALLLVTSLPSLAAEAQEPNLEQVGMEIETIMNARDEDAFVRMMDFQRLGYRIAATMVDTEKEREDYVRGFSKGTNAGRLSKVLFSNLKQHDNFSAKFMRDVDRGREHRALVRLNLGDLGFDYLEFVIEHDAHGMAKIVDWYALSSGELLSTSAGAMSRLLVDPAPGLLKAMFGLQTVDQATIKRIRHISDLRIKGEFKQAYLEMEKLPPEIASSRIMLTQRAGLASALGDDEAYRQMLEQLALRYADQPGTAFMLIDHYIYKQDYARCLDAIGRVEKRVGMDGMTYMLRANVHVLSNKLDEAAQNAREGVRVEPDFEGSYFSLADILVAQGKFDEAVEVFEDLQTEFGYEFSREALEAQPTYAKFVASRAFKRWQQ